MMIRKIILFICLVLMVYADMEVSGKCQSCSLGKGVCIRFNGGPFDQALFPTNQTSCKKELSGAYKFKCDSSCQGCQITIYEGSKKTTLCSQSKGGELLILLFDVAYSFMKGDQSLSSTYDWCQCGGSGGSVAGIVIAVIIFGAIAGAGIWYLRKRRSGPLDRHFDLPETNSAHQGTGHSFPN